MSAIRPEGVPPVDCEWNSGRPKCTVGASPAEDDAVAKVSVGQTDFTIVIPQEVKDAQAGKAGTQGIVGSLDKNLGLLGQLVPQLGKTGRPRRSPRMQRRAFEGI